MQQRTMQKILILSGVLLGIFLSFRYLLPLIFPFLLGAGLALAADPMVRFCREKLHLPKSISTLLGVGLTFTIICTVLLILIALLVRELGNLAGVLPNLEDTARQGLSLLESWLLGLADRTPDGIRPVLTNAVSQLFTGSTAFLDRVGQWLLELASGILHAIPDSAFGFGTMVLSSFMISVKLPVLRTALPERLPPIWEERYLPALNSLKSSLFAWLIAQSKLAGVTFLILTVGFLLLRISYAPLWALVIALVDALPLLGSGAVLIPWSIVSFLQADQVRAIGLLATYAAASVTRSTLEPRLVGKQLGLDPLVTLAALYAGYRLFGVGGMLLAPLIAVLTVRLVKDTLPRQ